jgi:hypothetical protein
LQKLLINELLDQKKSFFGPRDDLFVSGLLSDLFKLDVSVCMKILLAQLGDLKESFQ